MSVKIAAGEIYAAANLDDSAYSSLPADTAHQIVKQGINIDASTIALTAPTTAGQSINYLIEATFQESDTGSTVLPYYNSSDPTQAYSGPANSGAAQPTKRHGAAVVTAKPGAAAATGSQTTPAADAGYIGLCVVTVPFGATTITAGMISALSSAPVVPAGGILAAIKAISYASRAEALAGTATAKIISPDTLAQSVQSGSFLYGVAGGTATALTLALTPAPAALVAGMEVVFKAAAANTGAATLNLNGLGAKPVICNGTALKAGMLLSNVLYAVVYDGASWQLATPTQSGVIAYQLGQTGYEIYQHGRIEQWGIATSTTAGLINVTFPTPFPTSADSPMAINSSSGSPPTAFHGVDSMTTTGMVIRCAASAGTAAPTGVSAYWRVIGH